MGNIVIPNVFVNGEIIDAPQWMADLYAITSTVNGGLDDTNIRAGANIATAKLASDLGITGGMIANGTITGNKIASGFTTNNRNAFRMVTTPAMTLTSTHQTVGDASFAKPAGANSALVVMASIALLMGFNRSQAVSMQVLRNGAMFLPENMVARLVGVGGVGSLTQSVPVVFLDQPGGASTFHYEIQMRDSLSGGTECDTVYVAGFELV